MRTAIFTRYLIAALFMVFATCTIVAAKDVPPDNKPYLDDWSAAKTHLEKIGGNKDGCEDSWSVLWHWAKKGNLEARFTLFVLMLPGPDMVPILPPGNSGDRVSIYRDAVTMFTHSLGYKTEDQSHLDLNTHYQTGLSLYKKMGLGNDPRSSEFLQCLKENKKACAKIAVRNQIVPSFKNYARPIDIFLEKGMKPSCKTND